MVNVTLLGCGGTMPLPDRALTSAYLRCGSSAVLIDCGEGTQVAIRKAGLRFKPIDAILFTHYHADHISGLPGLLLTMGNEGRTDAVTLYGPEGLEQVVRALMVIVPELPFEIRFSEIQTQCDTVFSCCGLEISAIPMDHAVPCLGYGFTLNRPGKFDPQAARRKGIPVSLWGRLQKGESVDGFVSEDVLGAPRKGIRLLYATDSRPVERLRELAEDADLLILEGMFGDPEKLPRAKISQHMMMQEAAAIAAESGAQELWLTHFSPANPEPEQYALSVQEIFPNTVIGRDGLSGTLCFRD